jgi:hypothetical protein
MSGEGEGKPKVVIHLDPPKPPRTPHPCEVGVHRWAWLVNGRQACGYCGKFR